VSEWACDWLGIPIVVRRDERWFRTGVELYVGGVRVDSSESTVGARWFEYVGAPISVSGRRRIVQAFVGSGRGFSSRCVSP
jgi:hypothetical protein